MSHGKCVRLRGLALVVAFGIGLLGQVIAAVAMPMPMPQVKASLTHATANSSGCPSCPKWRDVPGSPAMAPACGVAFCSALPAVLPPGPIVTPRDRARFSLMFVGCTAGLTVRPDLGPPRPIHLT